MISFSDFMKIDFQLRKSMLGFLFQHYPNRGLVVRFSQKLKNVFSDAQENGCTFCWYGSNGLLRVDKIEPNSMQNPYPRTPTGATELMVEGYSYEETSKAFFR